VYGKDRSAVVNVHTAAGVSTILGVSARLIQLALWVLLGAALAYVTVGLLDMFGLLLVISLCVVGLAMFVIRSYRPPELVGLAAGPAIPFAIFGELDDAPGLILIAGAIVAATAAVYFTRLRRQSANPA
jgi:hypothetical protein